MLLTHSAVQSCSLVMPPRWQPCREYPHPQARADSPCTVRKIYLPQERSATEQQQQAVNSSLFDDETVAIKAANPGMGGVFLCNEFKAPAVQPALASNHVWGLKFPHICPRILSVGFLRQHTASHSSHTHPITHPHTHPHHTTHHTPHHTTHHTTPYHTTHHTTPHHTPHHSTHSD